MKVTPLKDALGVNSSNGLECLPLSCVLSSKYIPYGSTLFLSGDPGAGKTTLLVQSMAFVAERSQRPLLYNSTEQNVQAIKSVFERLNLRSDMIWFTDETDLQSVLDWSEENNVCFLCIDSLNESFVRSTMNGETKLFTAAKKLVQFTKARRCVSVGIRQINAEGSPAGEVRIDHASDTNMHLSVDESGMRNLQVRKNRHGVAPCSVKLHMGTRGLTLEQDPPFAPIALR